MIDRSVSLQICVALKKKQIQLYTVTEDRMIHLRDLNLSEHGVAVVSNF